MIMEDGGMIRLKSVLINRGLNFAITPLKVMCDLQKFERTVLWQEYWANHPQADPY